MANTTTTSDKKDYSWVGSVTGLLVVVARHGTLATVALLSVIGISIEIDEGLLVKLVSGLLALAGMGYSYRLHRLLAAALLLWVFYGSYSKPLELAGCRFRMGLSRQKTRLCVLKIMNPGA